MDVGDVANVSEVYATSIISVEESNVGESVYI
jgi:hypothetical protein